MKSLAIAALVLVIIAGGSIAFWMITSWRADLASNYVHTAWRIADGKLEIRSEMYDETDIPKELTTREEIALYYFLEAAKLAPRKSGAYFQLALWYRATDCAKAERYFRKHAEYVADDGDIRRVLSAFDLSCE